MHPGTFSELDYRLFRDSGICHGAKAIHPLQMLMTPKPFQSDSAYAGIPYRVLKDASVEALMPNGEILNFKTVEQFLAAANE